MALRHPVLVGADHVLGSDLDLTPRAQSRRDDQLARSGPEDFVGGVVRKQAMIGKSGRALRELRVDLRGVAPFGCVGEALVPPVLSAAPEAHFRKRGERIRLAAGRKLSIGIKRIVRFHDGERDEGEARPAHRRRIRARAFEQRLVGEAEPVRAPHVVGRVPQIAFRAQRGNRDQQLLSGNAVENMRIGVPICDLL